MTPTASPILNWGIIGNSDIARKRGGPAIREGGNRRLLSILCRDLDRARQFCVEHGAERPYADLGEFLADPDLHAVYVSTELHRHCAETVAAAEAGKHVLCEKPMALNPEECRRMIEACRANGVNLQIAFTRRYYAKADKMLELLRAGAIGKVVSARIESSGDYNPAADDPKHWRVVPNQGGGGNLQDMGSHYFDLVCHFLGEPELVLGLEGHLKHGYGVPDTESALVRMRSGCHVTGLFHWSQAIGVSQFDIYGTEGALLASPYEGSRLVLRRRGQPEEVFDLPVPENNYVPMVDDFTRRCLAGEGSRFTGEDGLLSTQIICAVQAAARTGAGQPL